MWHLTEWVNNTKMYNLGISCYYHDSAAALLKDGHVIAAVEEERFSRKKFDDGYPKMAIDWCLNESKPSTLGPKPSVCLGLFAANNAANVRP